MTITAKMPEVKDDEIAFFTFIQVNGKIGVVGSYFDKEEMDMLVDRYEDVHAEAIDKAVYLLDESEEQSLGNTGAFAKAFYMRKGNYVTDGKDSLFITFYKEEDEEVND